MSEQVKKTEKENQGNALTKITIDRAQPEAKAYLLADTENGLYLRIYPSGVKNGLSARESAAWKRAGLLASIQTCP